MKKSSWVRYGFYIFYLNYFIASIWANGNNIKNFIDKCYSYYDILKVIIFLSICILINFVIYRLVTIRYELSKKDYIIPICIMLFGLFVGISIGTLRYMESNNYLDIIK
ncbi:hypothetical protein KQI77_04135 [Clostridium sp. MSJ-8]|uniref:hypothetical protein n=1 Tax=Clostridium sp. MSJ-8 TaxID=2841510 RepID=UPI001C0F0FEB|nr:hypothetical protein [Clostridium sp. MSJ-8]MBU5487351.1 hypothetical protein [Clostridium sp. MSJ-8]